MDFDGRHVVVTQLNLFELAGSEVVTYELVRHLASRGARVTVVSYGFSADWLARFAELPAVRCFRLDDGDLEAHLREDPPHLAWIHHQLIPEELLRNPGGTAFVFHHMSSIQPQEFPISWELEADLASLVLFSSAVARDRHVANGWFDGIEPERVQVFGNPAPDEFFTDPPEQPPALERLVVVSNHMPPEVIEAIGSLAGEVEVTIIGRADQPGARPAPVTADTLRDADAVLTIGKTVQYALAGGRPVYCYDHFGGPGWLGDENFEVARAHTFSGRGEGFGSKDAETIVRELRGGFVAAAETAKHLRTAYAEEFRLSSVLDRVVAATHLRAARTPVRPRIEAHLALQQIFNGLTNAIEARQQTTEYQRGLLAQRDAELERYRDAEDRAAAELLEATEELEELRARVAAVASRRPSWVRRR
ncbi:glycosyltransferase [Agromyces sp. MMS24-K17]|uniref:glycosyltransferase n=1 Tax=Agromyces sp. MMS24-K17 TaxID=3372850 RepID=UPI0037542CFF